MNRWLRKGHSRVYGIAYFALGVLFAVFLGILVLAWLRWQDEDRLMALVIVGPVFVAFTYGLMRLGVGNFRAAVMITPEQVVVRNPWRRYALPLDAVDRFAAVEHDRLLYEDGVGIAVIDRRGKEVHVRGFFRDCFSLERGEGAQAL